MEPERWFQPGTKAMNEKNNRITAIPELLERLQMKRQVITIDAMRTQTAVVEKSGETG